MTKATWLPVVATLCLVGCAGVQSPLAPAGEQADRLYSLLELMVWICGAMYLAVLAFLGWSLWRARKRLRRTSARHRPPC